MRCKLLEQLLELVRKNGIRKTARDTGICLRTIEDWLYKSQSPSLVNAERVLNALGYEIAIVKAQGGI
jgi:DNA-binding phage protein